VKLDIAPNPIAVAALRANGVMLKPHDLAHLIQHLELGVGDDQVGPRAAALPPSARSSG